MSYLLGPGVTSLLCGNAVRARILYAGCMDCVMRLNSEVSLCLRVSFS